VTQKAFVFRGTRMRVHLSTATTGGSYALIEMTHPPSVGPALHIHPRGPESFFVLEGEYTFSLGSTTIVVSAGEAVAVPAGVAHRYVVGATGGRALVITPPELENYFIDIAKRLESGPVQLAEEFEVAARYGQEFLDHEGHWSS
jgi:quercetin dioxygenase-like cupin family protein